MNEHLETTDSGVSERKRSDVWRLLDNPMIWEGSRRAIDLAFGLYRRRMRVLQAWGVLEGGPSVLDIGCGIGQYAEITTGDYLGVDLMPKYIDYATRRARGATNRSFRCADVGTLVDEHREFDIVLMVDFLHHIDDESCAGLLETALRLSRRYLISFEPIDFQPNRVGQWIVEHDRGDHMRSLESYEALLTDSSWDIVYSTPLGLGPIGTRAVLCQRPDVG